MKTELEIASAISNYVTSNQGVTDFPVSLKQVSDEVDTLRVRLISEADAKGILARPYFNYTQTITFSATKLDAITRERYIDVPRLFILKNGKPAIAYCGGERGTKHYRVVSGFQREWHTHDRWIGKAPTAIVTETDEVDGFRIRFKNITPNKARIIAIFEDPSDLEPYDYDGWKTSSEGGSLYPMPSGEIDVIIGKTVESYLRTMYRTPLQANQMVDAPTTQKQP